MVKRTRKQKIQEDSYEFPYHYIPAGINSGNFTQTKILKWGYEYLSYLSFMLDRLKEFSFDSLLDVGCGDGRFLKEVLKNFPSRELTGMDYSDRALQYAKLFCPEKIEFVYGNISDEKLFEKKFDVAVSIETLEHIPPLKLSSFIKGIDFYLKDAGIFVLTVPSKNVYPSEKHYQSFDYQLLKKTLRPFFKISKLHYINKKARRTNFIAHLLSNKFFILNEKRLRKMIYKYYMKYLLEADQNNAKRICAICKKL